MVSAMPSSATSAKTDLQREIEAFQAWAVRFYPEARFGEWETEYPECEHLRRAFVGFLDACGPDAWDEESVDMLLYALARDHVII